MRKFFNNLALALVLAFITNATLPTIAIARVETVEAKQGIATAFGKLQYNLDSADPSDAYFQDYAKTQFENDIEDLIAQGVKPAQIQNYLESNLLTAQGKRDYRILLSSAKAQGLNNEEIATLAAQKFGHKVGATQGSSFSSGSSATYTKVAVVLGVIAVGVITFFVVKKLSKTKTKTKTETETNTQTETQTQTQTKTQTQTQTQTQTETKTKTQTKTQTKTKTNTQTKTKTKTKTETKTKCKTKTKTKCKTDCKPKKPKWPPKKPKKPKCPPKFGKKW